MRRNKGFEMNERIRQLAKQAGVGDNWNKADWYSMSPEMLEKFAELIVRECAEICLEANDHKNILRHFGVEE